MPEAQQKMERHFLSGQPLTGKSSSTNTVYTFMNNLEVGSPSKIAYICETK